MEIRAEDGWRSCMWSERPVYSQRRTLAEFARKEWEEPLRSTWDDLPHGMNIIGLYWRPIRPDETAVEPGQGVMGVGGAASGAAPRRWRDHWNITKLAPVADPQEWSWICIIERPQTQTAIHAPGTTAEDAMARAWGLAGLVEDGA